MTVIRMVTTAAGPDGVLSAGRVYEVPDSEAEPLVLGGYAVRISPVVRAVEAAVLEPGEHAALRIARPRGRARAAE